MKKSVTGFTIVELLIVIVVIAILAAISIVAYTGIQNRANDTSIQADLANISKKAAEFNVLNSRYPTSTTELQTLGLDVSRGAYDTSRELNLSYCIAGSGARYAIGGISKSGKRFYVSSQTGVTEYSSSYTNNGNQTAANNSCSDLLAGSHRVSGGFYSADPNNGGWRNWTGA